MDLMLERALGQHFIVSFTGKHELPRDMRAALTRQHVGGVELFPGKNIGTAAEVLALTTALQKAAAQSGQPLLLVAANQEGGRFMAVRDGTPFPTNMALGAVRSEELTERVGMAMGRELAAVGINVDFAPVADVNNNADNPVIGTRSFGDDPQWVARHVAAMVRGIQSAGVAATAKHFPGHGDTASDSHLGAPAIPHGLERLLHIELPPFQAAIGAGVHLVMTAHIILPRLTGGEDVPATVSPAVLRGLLRERLGFRGLIVTDAMDMKAIAQGPGLVVDSIAAIAAGADLLLFPQELSRQAEIFEALVHAAHRNLLDPDAVKESATRILALKEWLKGTTPPPLSVVGCHEHFALARDVAARAVTLVRDSAKLLPLRLAPETAVAVVVPRVDDLRGGASVSIVPPLAAAVRRRHPRVDDFSMPSNPSAADVRALAGQVSGHGLVIVATQNATAAPQSGQAALVNALVEGGVNTLVVGLGLPYDILAFPAAPVYVCAYGVLGLAMEAVADALWGRAAFPGQIPVSIPAKLRATS